jgi:hypothetical protein
MEYSWSNNTQKCWHLNYIVQHVYLPILPCRLEQECKKYYLWKHGILHKENAEGELKRVLRKLLRKNYWASVLETEEMNCCILLSYRSWNYIAGELVLGFLLPQRKFSTQALMWLLPNFTKAPNLGYLKLKIMCIEQTFEIFWPRYRNQASSNINNFFLIGYSF